VPCLSARRAWPGAWPTLLGWQQGRQRLQVNVTVLCTLRPALSFISLPPRAPSGSQTLSISTFLLYDALPQQVLDGRGTAIRHDIFNL